MTEHNTTEWEHPMQSELEVFARQISDYMATRITPWKDEDTMHEAVAEAVRLIFTEAILETLPLAERAHRWAHYPSHSGDVHGGGDG